MRNRRFARRPARRHAAWAWATNNNVTLTAGNISANKELLPARRVQWLLENETRSRITHVKTLLWLQVAFENASGATVVFPGASLWIMKGSAGSVNETYSPFTEPELPNAVTNWDASMGVEGTDPFLWCTRLWAAGSFGTINSFASLVTLAGGVVTGGSACIGDWGSHIQSNFHPNVEVKAKRRLEKNDGLIIGITGDAAWPTGTTLVVNYACRMLLA